MKSCKTPFFVWFTGRTGSTYLCDLLDSHPDVYCRKEDFSEIAIQSANTEIAPEHVVECRGSQFFRRLITEDEIIDHPTDHQTLRHLDTIFSQPSAAAGFKLKFPNQAIVYPEVVDRLKSWPEIKTIELIRENVLKQAISLRNVERIKKLGVSKSSNSVKSVDLEPLELDVELTISHARFFLKSREEFRLMSEGFQKVQRVSYEQILERPEPTLAALLEFLEVDPMPLASQFQKTTPDDLTKAIANFDELAEKIRGTELEPFLG